MAGLIVGALIGASKADLTGDHYCPVPGYWQENPLDPVIASIAAGSYKLANPPQIKGTGYAADAFRGSNAERGSREHNLLRLRSFWTTPV